MINRFLPSYIPTDTYFKNQWHLNPEDGPQLVKADSVDALSTWDKLEETEVL